MVCAARPWSYWSLVRQNVPDCNVRMPRRPSFLVSSGVFTALANSRSVLCPVFIRQCTLPSCYSHPDLPPQPQIPPKQSVTESIGEVEGEGRVCWRTPSPSTSPTDPAPRPSYRHLATRLGAPDGSHARGGTYALPLPISACHRLMPQSSPPGSRRQHALVVPAFLDESDRYSLAHAGDGQVMGKEVGQEKQRAQGGVGQEERRRRSGRCSGRPSTLPFWP